MVRNCAENNHPLHVENGGEGQARGRSEPGNRRSSTAARLSRGSQRRIVVKGGAGGAASKERAVASRNSETGLSRGDRNYQGRPVKNHSDAGAERGTSECGVQREIQEADGAYMECGPNSKANKKGNDSSTTTPVEMSGRATTDETTSPRAGIRDALISATPPGQKSVEQKKLVLQQELLRGPEQKNVGRGGGGGMLVARSDCRMFMRRRSGAGSNTNTNGNANVRNPIRGDLLEPSTSPRFPRREGFKKNAAGSVNVFQRLSSGSSRRSSGSVGRGEKIGGNDERNQNPSKKPVGVPRSSVVDGNVSHIISRQGSVENGANADGVGTPRTPIVEKSMMIGTSADDNGAQKRVSKWHRTNVEEPKSLKSSVVVDSVVVDSEKRSPSGTVSPKTICGQLFVESNKEAAAPPRDHKGKRETSSNSTSRSSTNRGSASTALVGLVGKGAVSQGPREIVGKDAVRDKDDNDKNHNDKRQKDIMEENNGGKLPGAVSLARSLSGASGASRSVVCGAAPESRRVPTPPSSKAAAGR